MPASQNTDRRILLWMAHQLNVIWLSGSLPPTNAVHPRDMYFLSVYFLYYCYFICYYCLFIRMVFKPSKYYIIIIYFSLLLLFIYYYCVLYIFYLFFFITVIFFIIVLFWMVLASKMGSIGRRKYASQSKPVRAPAVRTPANQMPTTLALSAERHAHLTRPDWLRCSCTSQCCSLSWHGPNFLWKAWHWPDYTCPF